MKLLVSACLLGRRCKYSGGSNYSEAVAALAEGHEVIEVCPELKAGLGVPRIPIELVDGVLMDKDGRNVDAALRAAVAEILADLPRIDCAILQPRSPTCGVKQIYDGTFTGRLIPGSGVFAKALMDAGYKVIDAQDVSEAAEARSEWDR